MPPKYRAPLSLAGLCVFLALMIPQRASYAMPMAMREMLWLFVLLVTGNNVLNAVRAKRERLEARGLVRTDPIYEKKKRREVLVGMFFLLAALIWVAVVGGKAGAIGNPWIGLFFGFGISFAFSAIGLILIAPYYLGWIMSFFPSDRED